MFHSKDATFAYDFLKVCVQDFALPMSSISAYIKVR